MVLLRPSSRVLAALRQPYSTYRLASCGGAFGGSGVSTTFPNPPLQRQSTGKFLSSLSSSSPQQQELPLSGKIALVTGGAGTIGLAIAQKCAGAGATVVLTARNLERLEAAAASIRAVQPDAVVHCLSCDVTQEASVVDLFDKMDQYGKIDLLINNAGVNVEGATTDLTADAFRWVLEVNVLGPFLCAREAMKRMKSNGGKIINIGSLSALSPRPDSCPYTTSKFALQGLTQSLALDGRAHNISVGIVHPGNVESPLLTAEIIAERQEEGFLQASDVADCVLTMASLPPSATVLELTVLPTRQPLVGRG